MADSSPRCTSELIEYITGTRGKQNVILDDNRYYLNKKRVLPDGIEKTYWACIVRTCTARLVLHNGKVKNSFPHNHKPQPTELSVHRAKVQLKQRAATSDVPTKTLVEETLSELNPESLSKLGCQISSLRKLARSARAVANKQPNLTSSSNHVPLKAPPKQLVADGISCLSDSINANKLCKSFLSFPPHTEAQNSGQTLQVPLEMLTQLIAGHCNDSGLQTKWSANIMNDVKRTYNKQPNLPISSLTEFLNPPLKQMVADGSSCSSTAQDIRNDLQVPQELQNQLPADHFADSGQQMSENSSKKSQIGDQIDSYFGQIEYTTGQRGKQNVILNDHRYYLNKKRVLPDGIEKTYWACTVRSCPARLVIHNEKVNNSISHNHNPDLTEITVHRAKARLKHRAATSNVPTKELVANTLAELNSECLANLGCQIDSLKKLVRSTRAANNKNSANSASSFTDDPPSIPPNHTLTDEDNGPFPALEAVSCQGQKEDCNLEVNA